MPRKVFYGDGDGDGSSDTIYSVTERLLAIPIGCVLFALGWADSLVYRYNLVTKIMLGGIGFVIGFGVLTCMWIAVVGGTSTD
jgi:hypothetical protein